MPLPTKAGKVVAHRKGDRDGLWHRIDVISANNRLYWGFGGECRCYSLDTEGWPFAVWHYEDKPLEFYQDKHV